MWSWKALLLIFFVGVTASDNPAWKINKEYKYSVTGRTLTALHQVSNQYAGILIRASLSLRLKSPNSLIAKISKPQYAYNPHETAGMECPDPRQGNSLEPASTLRETLGDKA
ncbi:unnamed protein product [Timema podura]|uniref:Vitellogenin domain-containing protein n=1 Tax=Timema podura TaxID=61482 RepID=A0ABN7NZU7_TIMPD|nr:unnamed protein product [Timema podura]